MNPDQLQLLAEYLQNNYPQYTNDGLLNSLYSNISLPRNGGYLSPNVQLNTFANNSGGETTLPTTPTQSEMPAMATSNGVSFPQAVINENPSDWIGDTFKYEGRNYTVNANGNWVDDNGNIYNPNTSQNNNTNNTSNSFDWNNYAPFLNPYGTNMQTDFYNFGRYLGMEQGTPGRGLGIAGAGVASILGGARTALSGYANSVASARSMQDAREKMQRRLYTPQTQYRNTNYLGGDIK